MSILKSVFSLSALKAIDFIVPLIIIPFAIQKYGLSYYGIVAVFQTIAMMFSNIIDFGFTVVGIQRLSVNKSTRVENYYLSAATLIKLLLAILSLPIYFILMYLSPYATHHDLIYIFSIVIILSCFNYQWYFQAKLKYKILIYISLFVRIFSISIFVLLSYMTDNNVLLPIVLVFMFVLPFIIHFFLIKNKFKRVNRHYIMMVFKSNMSVFSYRIVSNIILPSYVYLMGFIFSPYQLGILSVVQRLLGAVLNFMTPISQALIPHLSIAKNKKNGSFDKIYQKSFLSLFTISILLTGMFPLIIIVYYKYKQIDQPLIDLVIPSLLILSMVPHIVNSLISQVLVLFGAKNSVNKSVYFSIIITIPVLVYLFIERSPYLILLYGLTYWIMMFSLIIEKKRCIHDKYL